MAQLLADGGSAPRVPIVFGVTSHEGILMLPGVATPEALAHVDKDFECVVPYDLQADRSNTERTLEICQLVRDFYFDGKPLAEETLEGFVNLNTDTVFVYPVMLTARAHARLGAPVFLFEFSYVGRQNYLGPLFGSQRVPGACHADELGYLFNVERLPPMEEGSPEHRVRRQMVRMWVDFAKNGNPSPSLDEEINQKWKQFSEAEPNYLQIGEDLSGNIGLSKERIAFWDELYRSEGTQKRFLINRSQD